MPSETTTACVSLLVFFRIRRGTFPYGVEDDASIISQTPTTHYTSTCVKLMIVTHLSFSERIGIANLSYHYTIHSECELFGINQSSIFFCGSKTLLNLRLVTIATRLEDQ